MGSEEEDVQVGAARYPEEFKRDAVELVRSSGRTPTEVARELGVSPEGLRNWVNQAKADRGAPGPPRAGWHTPVTTSRRCPVGDRWCQHTRDTLYRCAMTTYAVTLLAAILP